MRRRMVMIGKLILLLAALAVIAAGLELYAVGFAEEEGEIWILCREDSYVNIRERANRRAAIGGQAYCGDHFRTDWETKGEWIHIIDASTESGDGWINAGYVIYTEPENAGGAEMRIREGGRVAARKTIRGKRTKWLKAGSGIRVYWIGEEWSITDQGFVMTEYIE